MPKSIKIKSSAKINLCLDILKRLPSGWHEIQTIFYELKSLHDLIEIKETQAKDELSTVFNPQKFKNPPTIQQKDNLAYKALKLLKKNYKIKKFANITIYKNIPLSSGLGGASSNAAAVLKGLNKLWKLKLGKKELAALAAKLGSDVPFFIYGGCALGTHYGEIIQPLKKINLKLKIIEKSSNNPKKTKSAYQKLNLKNCAKNLEKTQKLLAAIKSGNKKEILKNIHNDFETTQKVPKGFHLSGAGPSLSKIPSFLSAPSSK